jgi:hypothetical protein
MRSKYFNELFGRFIKSPYICITIKNIENMKTIKLLFLALLISLSTSCKKDNIEKNQCSTVNCEQVSEQLSDIFTFFSFWWYEIHEPMMISGIIASTGQLTTNIAGESIPEGELLNHLPNGQLRPSVLTLLTQKANERDSLINLLDNCCGGHELYWQYSFYINDENGNPNYQSGYDDFIWNP